ncbi:MAG: radical SAM protein [Candidatus Pacebacteria bacterium]|nr:radical SAM protein [Candidatus Paceibacterota bacterium]MDD4998899.1 radical SAM protein [Candidatus Paceibacterota bacterium]
MTPIIKIVGNYCNLRCMYCFYYGKDQSTVTIMSHRILEKFIEEYTKLYEGNLTFNWHGGEPLLAGLPFFKEIVNLQGIYKRSGQIIRNTVQTNATLINDEWGKFFKEYNFHIGVSIDGAEKSHSQFRRHNNQEGSFKETVRGIKVLQKYGIKVGIIQTVTRENIEYAQENFNFFFNDLDIKSLGINAYLDIMGNNKKMINQSVSNEDFAFLLKSYIDLWLIRDDPTIQIREIDNFIAGIMEKQVTSCNFNGSCTKFFCINYDGKIYSSCDRFSGQQKMFIGNLDQQPLLEILDHFSKSKVKLRINSLPNDCIFCEWRQVCHNGCTYHRIGGIDGKYYYCKTRKEIFSYLREKIKNMPKLNQEFLN